MGVPVPGPAPPPADGQSSTLLYAGLCEGQSFPAEPSVISRRSSHTQGRRPTAKGQTVDVGEVWTSPGKSVLIFREKKP